MEKQGELLNFCHNVRILRQRENLSKKKMAEIMGIGRHSLNLIENGIIPERLGARSVMNICFAFNIQPKDVFTKI